MTTLRQRFILRIFVICRFVVIFLFLTLSLISLLHIAHDKRSLIFVKLNCLISQVIIHITVTLCRITTRTEKVRKKTYFCFGPVFINASRLSFTSNPEMRIWINICPFFSFSLSLSHFRSLSSLYSLCFACHFKKFYYYSVIVCRLYVLSFSLISLMVPATIFKYQNERDDILNINRM